MRRFVPKTIGAKLLGAFLLMGVIIGALGTYGYGVLSTAGEMVEHTYDGPMMAINYGRAASFDFSQIQKEMFRRQSAKPAQYADIDKNIDELIDTFNGDLEVAKERSSEADELAVIRGIETDMQRWSAARRARKSDAQLEAMETKIIDDFDMMVELNADHSFVGRRKAVWAISYYKYASIGFTIFSLLLALGITIVLTRRIARPLASAAKVADRIAAGELQTPIPQGGADETGILLNSMTVMQDNIREMVERETARAQSAETRLVDALESSGEGMVLANADGNVIAANSQVAKFFPQSEFQLAARNSLLSVLAAMEAELTPASDSQWQLSRFRFGDAQFSGSIERQLPDGRWLRFHGTPTQDGGYILLLSDFTDIKDREELYRKAKTEAETASAAKSRFLANMSHELRTPLNAIIGFSEVISGQMFGELGNARYLEYSSDILRSGRHLLEVINSVLDIAKTETGRLDIKAEAVDLGYVLMDCSKMMRDQCIAAGVTLTMEPVLRSLIVNGEKAKLRQIFINLLSNASKFTDPGGNIVLRAYTDDGMIVVEVRDTGIGMSEQDIAVALTPFGQVDNRLERRYEGTGLGLPLTKALVDLHQGVLLIESVPAKGTTVTVRLPNADILADRGDDDLIAIAG